MSPAPKKPPLFDKLANNQESSAGYDLVGNMVIGLGLVWVARYFWPSLPKASYGAGVVLGAISGFYQLFKSQSKKRGQPKAPESHDDAQPPR